MCITFSTVTVKLRGKCEKDYPAFLITLTEVYRKFTARYKLRLSFSWCYFILV